MVQFFQGGPSRSALQAAILGPALGEGLGNMATTYFANQSLDKVLNDKTYAKKPLAERYDALERATRPFGEKGRGLLQQRLGIENQFEQDRQEKLQQRQQGILAKSMRNEPLTLEEEQELSPENQFKKAEIDRKRNEFEAKKNEALNIYEGLRGLGVPEKRAKNWQKLYENSPQGGQSKIIEGLNEDIRRAQAGEFNQSNVDQQTSEYPPAESFFSSDLLPAERIKLEAETRKNNQPIFEELQTQNRYLKKEKQALGILNDINERRNLPEKSGERVIFIDPETGALRPLAQILKGSHPDTQRFIKTIYDFTTQAKDSFGARVTNFDLQTFLNRLPGLMNDYEGRKQIIQQMNIINDLNKLYSGKLKDIFTHYGLGKIPYEKAVQLTENRIADEEERLSSQFSEIGSQEEMVPSKQMEKVPLKDAKTLDEIFS